MLRGSHCYSPNLRADGYSFKVVVGFKDLLEPWDEALSTRLIEKNSSAYPSTRLAYSAAPLAAR